MKVKVEYLGHIKRLTHDTREEEIEVASPAAVIDVLVILADKYGEPFTKAIYEPSASDIKANYIMTVNGYLLNQLNGVQTRLKGGDHLILLPIVSGG